ncbi:restriction endonuclease subunit S [Streptomyces sp. KR80]|uniref:restriction endonuclease subunit S n=1 Tax=Streptomyces sp. KR80 TaxID=3457426 RepID=UPI003FD0770D
MELPVGWAWSRLGDLGEYINGRGFKKAEWSDTGRPIIRIQNLTGSGATFNHYAGELDKRHTVFSGDLLVSWAATLGVYIWRGPEAALNQHIFKVEPFIDRDFLRYLIDYKIQELVAASHGSGMVHVTRSKFDALVVAIPPLPEQHRIVEALEDHLSRLDAAVHILRIAQNRSSFLKKSVVEKAMRGDLALQSDEDESVYDLLERVESDILLAADRKRRKVVAPATLSVYANPPSHWSVQPLGALCHNIEYGTSAKAHTDPVDGDVPVLRMGNIQDSRLDLRNLKYLPGEHSEAAKLLLQDGDLLFNRTNSAELVGKSAVYRSVMGPATFASYLIRCQLAHGVEPEWVNLCINSPEGRRYVASVAAQQVGQANVNGAKLAAFPIPLPPHGEQLRILTELRDWDETVDRTTKVTGRALHRSVHLRQALLHRAFAGKLVPQDPLDEPASVLLDRIRAKREAQDSAHKRARRPRKAESALPPPSASAPIPTTAVQQEFEL